MRVPSLTAAMMLCLTLLVSPGATAQADGGEVAQFWAHHTNADGCCDIWFNDVRDDPDHTLDAVSTLMLPSNEAWPSNPGTPVWPNLGGSAINYEMSPALAAPLRLNPAGSVLFDVYVGAEEAAVLTGVPGAPVAGQGELTVSLRQGDHIIAETEPQPVEFVAEILHLELEAPVQKADIEPGDGALVWRFHWVGVAPVLVIGGGDSTGHSNFVLPLAAPAPESGTIFEDLDESSLSQSFANATSDTYILNFTTELANSTAGFSWNATSGSVNATLMDANGTTVFEGVFEGNGTLSHEILDAAPGDWNLTLAYHGFNGTLSFNLLEPEAEEPDATDEDDDTGAGNGTVDDNETAQLNDTDKESPVPILVALAALLVAVRRRR